MITEYNNKGINMNLSDIARETFKRDKNLRRAVQRTNAMAGCTEKDLNGIDLRNKQCQSN